MLRELVLSGRCRQVYDLIGAGLTDKEIATELGKSHGTVKVYACQVYRKTGMDRYGIIRACAERDVLALLQQIPGVPDLGDVITRRRGLQIFHNGRPVELLERTGGTEFEQEWRVKPLFVEGPEFTTVIRSTDRCTRLHTQDAR